MMPLGQVGSAKAVSHLIVLLSRSPPRQDRTGGEKGTETAKGLSMAVQLNDIAALVSLPGGRTHRG